MISRALNALDNGLGAIRTNSKLLLVVVVLFAFPLLFIWISEQFYTTAYDNIATAEKQRVGLLHDSVAALVASEDFSTSQVNAIIDEVAADNEDITKFRLVERQADDSLRVIAALNPELVGTTITNTEAYESLPMLATSQVLIFPLLINDVRTWQVFRSVDKGDAQYFIFSEHQFGITDRIMAARRQQSYFGLTAIFAFVMALAYWIHRQEHWKQQHASLEERLKERDLFSNMIAHEFRAPLTAIKGYASFLQESENLAASESRYVKNIRTSTERLILLVNDFLEVARLQSGKLTIEPKALDLRNVIEQTISDLSAAAQEKGLKLSYEKPRVAQVITSDENRLIQVLTNLVSNSLKYTSQGSVTIESQIQKRQAVIRIKDTGTGISAEDQRKLFAPFTRVGNADQSTVTGSGLGMWITKQLVELLGGTIGVESIEGIGTHIVVQLPLEMK